MNVRYLIGLRRFSQLVFLLLFLFLLIESRLPTDLYMEAPESELRIQWPTGFFFQMDPLVALSSWVSGHRLISGFLWALGVLLLALFLGRIFCGFICPFGTLHHFTGWFRPELKGARMAEANRKNEAQKIKYFILILFLSGALLGLNLSGLLDPISFLFRSLALSILPALGTAVHADTGWMAASNIGFVSRFGHGTEELLSPIFGFADPSVQTAFGIGILFLLAIFLNRIRPRFWCRTICPLGGLLGLCSRFSALKLQKDESKCTQCGRCERQCQGAASPKPGQDWERSECLVCLNCVHVCPEDALDFSFSIRPEPKRKTDVGRRAVLAGLAAGFSLPLLSRLDGRYAKVADARLIRPPGTLPENDFLALCQRCGLCMKACPTNAINPTLGEAGVAGIWTPRLIMTLGYCDFTCTLCSSVCPTGAIREITAKEKTETPIKIGSVYLDRGRCLPWSGNAPCIVCEEHCPTSPKAIFLKEEIVSGPDGKQMRFRLPFIDLKRCVGCGICENKCPVRGEPAVRTISAGESRSRKNQILL